MGAEERARQPLKRPPGVTDRTPTCRSHDDLDPGSQRALPAPFDGRKEARDRVHRRGITGVSELGIAANWEEPWLKPQFGDPGLLVGLRHEFDLVDLLHQGIGIMGVECPFNRRAVACLRVAGQNDGALVHADFEAERPVTQGIVQAGQDLLHVLWSAQVRPGNVKCKECGTIGTAPTGRWF
jgi:hypothetical protein